MKRLFQIFLSLLYLAWGISVLCSLSSCNPVAIFNPDSYGRKWSNEFAFFNPKDLSTLLVGKSHVPGEDNMVPNGSAYTITWEKGDSLCRLKLKSHYHKIHFAWFSGYDAEGPDEEQPWTNIDDYTLELEMRRNKLVTPDSIYYQLFISEDLTK